MCMILYVYSIKVLCIKYNLMCSIKVLRMCMILYVYSIVNEHVTDMVSSHAHHHCSQLFYQQISCPNY